MVEQWDRFKFVRYVFKRDGLLIRCLSLVYGQAMPKDLGGVSFNRVTLDTVPSLISVIRMEEKPGIYEDTKLTTKGDFFLKNLNQNWETLTQEAKRDFLGQLEKLHRGHTMFSLMPLAIRKHIASSRTRNWELAMRIDEACTLLDAELQLALTL